MLGPRSLSPIGSLSEKQKIRDPESLSRRARQRLRNRAKAWLNTAAADCMTPERLAESDPAGEIPQWLATIGRFAVDG